MLDKSAPRDFDSRGTVLKRVSPLVMGISIIFSFNLVSFQIAYSNKLNGGADIFLDIHPQLLSILKRAEPSEC